jgi:two-component system response regulator GlrR
LEKNNQSPCNILIIDDDANIYKLIKLNLESEQFRVSYARNSRQAQTLMAGTRFDLILIDLLMPEIDGLALFRSLKQDLPLNTLIILITAHVLEQPLMTAVEEGIYDIIQKPFTANRLKLSIRNAWNYKLLLDERLKNKTEPV